MKTAKNKIYNLTAKEAFELLQSDKMANYKTNIQFNKPTHGGNNHGGRKTGSKNKMTLAKLAKIVEEGFARQEQRWAKQEQFNQHMLEFEKYVLDVFKRNELFQEEVYRQFNKHGWTK